MPEVPPSAPPIPADSAGMEKRGKKRVLRGPGHGPIGCISLFFLQTLPAEGLRIGDPRPGSPPGHAHGIGQVPLLSTPRDYAQRHNPCGQPPHCTDGGSNRRAAAKGVCGGPDPFRTHPFRFPPGMPGLPGWRTGIPLHRPGEVGCPGVSGDVGAAETGPHRHRRGPLHFPVGSRFQTRLPAVGGKAAHPSSGPRHRHDGNRHAEGPERYRSAVGDGGDRDVHPRFPADQYRHRTGGTHAVGPVRQGH